MPGRAETGTISSIGAMVNIGVGPGAHGRVVTPKGRRAQSTERHPEMWLTVVETEGNGLVENELLTEEEQGDEFLLTGLRLTEGIDPARSRRSRPGSTQHASHRWSKRAWSK